MQQEQQQADSISTAERRKRTWRIVIAHVLVVAMFFIATFLWSKFT